MHPRIALLPFGLLAAIGLTNAAAAVHLLTAARPDQALGLVMLAASLATLGAGWVLAARGVTPLAQLAESPGAVARGDRMVAIPGLGRADEIGAMAAAIAQLRDRASPSPLHAAIERPVMVEDDVATGPEADIERRAGIRVPLRRGALLELAGRRAIAVNLLDLSEGGAALDATGAGAAVGMEGALVFGTSLLPMRVVALGEDRIHLAFTALSPEARLAIRHMMNRAEQALAA